AVTALRARQKRNFLVTLFLSQGVPMLLSGDEMGRSQGGNNNAYCQDNQVSWQDWPPDGPAAADQGLLQFTETLASLRREHPVFRRRRFFRGSRDEPGDATSDIVWLTPSGQEMAQQDWDAGYAQSLAVFLNGEAISEPDPRGGRIIDAKFLLLFNAHSEALTFTLPEASLAAGWEVVIDTTTAEAPEEGSGSALMPKTEVQVPARTVIVLRSAE
ncbi:MAG: glycogen debranching enzyme, partial [Streptosporangiaceae bacterium]